MLYNFLELDNESSNSRNCKTWWNYKAWISYLLWWLISLYYNFTMLYNFLEFDDSLSSSRKLKSMVQYYKVMSHHHTTWWNFTIWWNYKASIFWIWFHGSTFLHSCSKNPLLYTTIKVNLDLRMRRNTSLFNEKAVLFYTIVKSQKICRTIGVTIGTNGQ